jgi:hypothetical protein
MVARFGRNGLNQNKKERLKRVLDLAPEVGSKERRMQPARPFTFALVKTRFAPSVSRFSSLRFALLVVALLRLWALECSGIATVPAQFRLLIGEWLSQAS